MAFDVLIVDDEADIRTLIGDILTDEGYECRLAKDSDTALKAIEERRPSLVILDIWLQGSRLDGLQILEAIMRDHPMVPVVMISGHGTIDTAVRAIKMGAYEFIEKPFQADRLLLVVERAIDSARLKREIAELKLGRGAETDVVGSSAAVSQLRTAVDRVAPTESRVLITGPAGAGKEVVARLLHEKSRRSEGPFVVLNCATLAPDRVETELFGTERGADGPQSVRAVGMFEQAHGGTLLLDEVCDMPIETQGKMVRVLQDQSFTRVGGSTRVKVDVRVVASSNRDLQAEMTAGKFRQDLFYRLNVVPITVPPLRARRDDVPGLARYFMARSAEAAGLPQRQIGEDAMAALQTYEWPGNVRQLRNVIDWILIMAPGNPGEPVRAEQLPPEVGAATPATLRWEKGAEIMALPLREARELFERQYLMAQVNRFGGNISRTAAFVGMERSALHRKLKLLGLTTAERGEGA